MQAKLSFWTVCLQMLIGLALALLLNMRSSLLQALRTAFLIPMVLPPIVVAIIWKVLYTPDISPFYWGFAALGWKVPTLITDADWALRGYDGGSGERMNGTADLLLDVRNRTGEGPVWDAGARALWWTDIPASHIHRLSVETKVHRSDRQPTPLQRPGPTPALRLEPRWELRPTVVCAVDGVALQSKASAKEDEFPPKEAASHLS